MIRTGIRICGVAFFILCVFELHAQNNILKKATLTTEKQLTVDLSGAFGTVYVTKGDPTNAYCVKFKRKGDEPDNITVRYSVKDNCGILRIELNTDSQADGLGDFLKLFKGKDGNVILLELSDRVAVAYKMELGAGTANLDFSGLRINGLHLESGASSVKIKMNTQNPEIIKRASIEAGVGSVHSIGLGNLNFEHLRFEGGLGSYMLDFTGDLRDGAKISAEVGLGSLSIQLPEGIGARARCDDNFLTSTNLQHFTRLGDSLYETPSYEDASKHVQLELTSGLGSVGVRWKKR